MVLFDLLQMTKAKIAILILLLIFLIPSYIDLGCIEGLCMAGREICACGFLPLEFFVTFVWTYVIAAFIVEFAKLIGSLIKKKQE